MTPPSLLFAFMTWVRHLKPDKTYIKMYFKNLVVKRTLWYNFKMYFFSLRSWKMIVNREF